MTKVSEAFDTPETHTSRSSWGRLAKILLIVGLLFLVGSLGLKAWRVFQAGSSLLQHQTAIEQLSGGGWRQMDPDELEDLVLGIRGDVHTLKEETGFLMPLMPLFSGLPEVGPLAAAAPALMEMADAGTEAAAYGMRGMKPAVAAVQGDGGGQPLLPLILDTVNEAQPDLARATLALNRVAAAREEIDDIEALPWRIRTLLEKADTWMRSGQNFARLALVLPDLMGYDGTRRYLILAQNQDELRPTGGFISGAGYLEVENGEIKGLDFIDANFVDAWEYGDWAGGRLIKPYDSPPQPLQDIMLLDLFLFRDANIWPDFTISGQKAMDFYAYGRDVAPLDGAIGINQTFLLHLLRGLGQVTIAETGEVIGSGNVVESLQQAWTLQEGVNERKAFLGPFALAILNRVEGGLSEIDPLHLIEQLQQSLDQKDLQIYARDPEVATILAANNWDGRLIPPSSYDALMIVDTNVGYNKANYLVDRDVNYDVVLGASGDSVANLSVTHRHHGTADGEPCRQGTFEEYATGAPYLDLTDKCYWNYLRVYAPAGSELLHGPSHFVPADTWFGGYDWQRETEQVDELPGYTTFGTFMLLPRGESVTSDFQYTLPPTVVQTSGSTQVYRLALTKQAGAAPYHVQVAVTIPPGTTVVDTYPDPVAIEGAKLIFSLEMDRDQEIAVAFR